MKTFEKYKMALEITLELQKKESETVKNLKSSVKKLRHFFKYCFDAKNFFCSFLKKWLLKIITIRVQNTIEVF